LTKCNKNAQRVKLTRRVTNVILITWSWIGQIGQMYFNFSLRSGQVSVAYDRL